MLVIFTRTTFVQSRNHTEYLSTWKFELPKTKYELTFSFLVFFFHPDLLYVYVCLPAYTYNTHIQCILCMPGAQGSQILSHHSTGCWELNLVLLKSNQCSQPLSHLSSLGGGLFVLFYFILNVKNMT